MKAKEAYNIYYKICTYRANLAPPQEWMKPLL